MGEAELELRMEDVCAYLCVCMCVKLDPLIQKPFPGTTAGTRLLLGLSTVAPQEQQKTPPNAPCSSSVNTHTWKHAATHKCTTYTSSKPTALSKHSKTHCFFGVSHVCSEGARLLGRRMGRALRTAIRWTAGQHGARPVLTACVCVQPHIHAGH